MDFIDFTNDEKAFAYEQFRNACSVDEEPIKYFGRLITKYLDADEYKFHDLEGDQYRAIVNEVLAHVCGYELGTIIDKAKKGEIIDA